MRRRRGIPVTAPITGRPANYLSVAYFPSAVFQTAAVDGAAEIPFGLARVGETATARGDTSHVTAAGEVSTNGVAGRWPAAGHIDVFYRRYS